MLLFKKLMSTSRQEECPLNDVIKPNNQVYFYLAIAPIPPPVHKIANFHKGNYYHIMMSPEGSLGNIRSLDEDSLRLYYLIATGVDQITHLIEFLGLHRSTVSKKANELQQLGLINVEIKPGTEKKYRPTKIFVLTPNISVDMIREIAEEKGVGLEIESKGDRTNTTHADTYQLIPELEASEQSFQPMERNQSMDSQEQFRLQQPNNLLNLGQPLNSSSNPKLPKLPGLPEYDPSWSDAMKSDWMKAYTLLLNKASQ